MFLSSSKNAARWQTYRGFEHAVVSDIPNLTGRFEPREPNLYSINEAFFLKIANKATLLPSLAPEEGCLNFQLEKSGEQYFPFH